MAEKLEKASGGLELGGREYVVIPTDKEFSGIIEKLLKENLQEIKQRIKSACEFYLRYKDDPVLLSQERLEEYGDELSPFLTSNDSLIIVDYNEWLFRLAFKSVLEDEK